MGVACSYNPQPESGKQECYEGRCPGGYQCGLYNLCYRAGKVPADPGTGGAIVGTGGAIVGTGGAMVGTGGAVGSGGTIAGTGGSVGTGGATVGRDAGIPGTGGAVGADAYVPPIPTGTVMTVANNQAQGAMTGFGWIASGPKDIITDPTCASPAGSITSGVFCNLTTWSMTTAYCVSGSIPILPPSPTTADYNDNWGIQIGVNATDPPGGGLGQSFASLAITIPGVPSSGLRAVLHRRGDAPEKTYCAPMASGTPIAFTSFNTTCWDGLGTRLTAADVPNVDQIGVQVSSNSSAAIAVSGLCLSGITFGK